MPTISSYKWEKGWQRMTFNNKLVKAWLAQGHTYWEEFLGSKLPISNAASANQNVTNNILHTRHKEWLPCMTHKLTQRNRVEDKWWWWMLESGWDYHAFQHWVNVHCSKKETRIWFASEMLLENSTKNRVHQISFCSWFRSKFMILTLFSSKKKFHHSVLCHWVTPTSVGGCSPLESMTTQHLLGMDWIRLWITCARMATHSCFSAWNNSCTFAGCSPCLRHVSPIRSKRVCLGLSLTTWKAWGEIWTLLARNCEVFRAAWSLT